MVSFIHIADVHYGMAPDKGFPWSEERKNEIKRTFNKVISMCNEKKTDLLLIAGDLFHKSPTLTELKEVSAEFDRLQRTKVVMIAGNHDYVAQGSSYDRFVFGKNVFFLKKNVPQTIYFEDLGVSVTGSSFNERKVTKPFSPDEYRDVQEEGKASILLLHGGTPDAVPFDAKDLKNSGFSYVALGHIHVPGKVTDNAYYAGSMEPLNRNETGLRGCILGRIDDSGEVAAEYDYVALRSYVNLEITVDTSDTSMTVEEKVRGAISENGSDNIYSLCLNGYTDPDVRIDAALIERCGNVVNLTDNTLPDYDFEKLYRENRDNVVGLYVDKIRKSTIPDEIADRALYLGIQALLGKA